MIIQRPGLGCRAQYGEPFALQPKVMLPFSENPESLSATMCCLAASVTSTVRGKASAPKKWGKSRPYFGSVLALEGLCVLSDADDKNTVRMEVDLGDSGLTYLPGDALGIYPVNDSKVGAINGCLRANA